MNCKTDGDFYRDPEPRAENIAELGEKVKSEKADIGFALDPDADRLALVDETGTPLSEEYTLALAVDQVLGMEKRGPVVVNVSTSALIDWVAAKHGVERRPHARRRGARGRRDVQGERPDRRRGKRGRDLSRRSTRDATGCSGWPLFCNCLPRGKSSLDAADRAVSRVPHVEDEDAVGRRILRRADFWLNQSRWNLLELTRRTASRRFSTTGGSTCASPTRKGVVRVLAESMSPARTAALVEAARDVLDRIARAVRVREERTHHVRNRRLHRTSTRRSPILIEGLKRLEYRGYDSAGIAIVNGGRILLEKTKGKISELEAHLSGKSYPGVDRDRPHAVGDPRGAQPAERAPAPRLLGQDRRRAQRDHRELSDPQEAAPGQGAHVHDATPTPRSSRTSSRITTPGRLEDAVRKAAEQLEGTYGIVVLSRDEPDKIVGVRNGSPLVVGVGDDEYFLASDVSAILKHTRQVIYLDDNEMAIVEPTGFKTMTIENVTVDKEIQEVDWDLDMIEKGGFPHFMLKEIFEQPETIRNAMRGRLVHDDGRRPSRRAAGCPSRSCAI